MQSNRYTAFAARRREAGECGVVGQRQMTEIMRNLMLDAKVVIMDEPTAAPDRT